MDAYVAEHGGGTSQGGDGYYHDGSVDGYYNEEDYQEPYNEHDGYYYEGEYEGDLEGYHGEDMFFLGEPSPVDPEQLDIMTATWKMMTTMCHPC